MVMVGVRVRGGECEGKRGLVTRSRRFGGLSRER